MIPIISTTAHSRKRFSITRFFSQPISIIAHSHLSSPRHTQFRINLIKTRNLYTEIALFTQTKARPHNKQRLRQSTHTDKNRHIWESDSRHIILHIMASERVGEMRGEFRTTTSTCKRKHNGRFIAGGRNDALLLRTFEFRAVFCKRTGRCTFARLVVIVKIYCCAADFGSEVGCR